MLPDEVKQRIHALYAKQSASGKFSPGMTSLLEGLGQLDPDFVGELRQSGTEAHSVPFEPQTFGGAMREFIGSPRETMDDFALIDVSPEATGKHSPSRVGPVPVRSDYPLEKDSFLSQAFNVAEAVPLVSNIIDPLVRTEMESRKPEDRSELHSVAKGVSQSIPIAVSTAAAAAPVLGVAGASALAGGATELALGGVPFVDPNMTDERNMQRVAQTAIGSVAGYAGGKISVGLNKWLGKQLGQTIKNVSQPGNATTTAVVKMIDEGADPLALASALTGGTQALPDAVHAVIQAAGPKVLTDAAARQVATQLGKAESQKLVANAGADLALGIAETWGQAKVEGRDASPLEYLAAGVLPATIAGAEYGHNRSNVKKVSQQIGKTFNQELAPPDSVSAPKITPVTNIPAGATPLTDTPGTVSEDGTVGIPIRTQDGRYGFAVEGEPDIRPMPDEALTPEFVDEITKRVGAYNLLGDEYVHIKEQAFRKSPNFEKVKDTVLSEKIINKKRAEYKSRHKAIIAKRLEEARAAGEDHGIPDNVLEGYPDLKLKQMYNMDIGAVLPTQEEFIAAVRPLAAKAHATNVVGLDQEISKAKAAHKRAVLAAIRDGQEVPAEVRAPYEVSLGDTVPDFLPAEIQGEPISQMTFEQVLSAYAPTLQAKLNTTSDPLSIRALELQQRKNVEAKYVKAIESLEASGEAVSPEAKASMEAIKAKSKEKEAKPKKEKAPKEKKGRKAKTSATLPEDTVVTPLTPAEADAAEVSAQELQARAAEPAMGASTPTPEFVEGPDGLVEVSSTPDPILPQKAAADLPEDNPTPASKPNPITFKPEKATSTTPPSSFKNLFTDARRQSPQPVPSPDNLVRLAEGDLNRYTKLLYDKYEKAGVDVDTLFNSLETVISPSERVRLSALETKVEDAIASRKAVQKRKDADPIKRYSSELIEESNKKAEEEGKLLAPFESDEDESVSQFGPANLVLHPAIKPAPLPEDSYEVSKPIVVPTHEARPAIEPTTASNVEKGKWKKRKDFKESGIWTVQIGDKVFEVEETGAGGPHEGQYIDSKGNKFGIGTAAVEEALLSKGTPVAQAAPAKAKAPKAPKAEKPASKAALAMAKRLAEKSEEAFEKAQDAYDAKWPEGTDIEQVVVAQNAAEMAANADVKKLTPAEVKAKVEELTAQKAAEEAAIEELASKAAGDAAELRKLKKAEPFGDVSMRPREGVPNDPYAGTHYRSRLYETLTQKFKPNQKFGSKEEAMKAILGKGNVSKAEILRAINDSGLPDKPTIQDITEALIANALKIEEVSGEFDMYGDSVSTPGTSNRRMFAFKLPYEEGEFGSADTHMPVAAWSEDESNGSKVAFHIRVSDMPLPGGKKALVLEEIQSDAAEDFQKGRGSDFVWSDPKSRNRIAIERAMKIAAEEGYDAIVIAPPAEQSRRNQSAGMSQFDYEGVERHSSGDYFLFNRRGGFAGPVPKEQIQKYVDRLDAKGGLGKVYFDAEDVGFGTSKAVENNYAKIINPSFESKIKDFGGNVEVFTTKNIDIEDRTFNPGWESDIRIGPIEFNAVTGKVVTPEHTSPAWLAAKDYFDSAEKIYDSGKSRYLLGDLQGTPEYDDLVRLNRDAIDARNTYDYFLEKADAKLRRHDPHFEDVTDATRLDTIEEAMLNHTASTFLSAQEIYDLRTAKDWMTFKRKSYEELKQKAVESLRASSKHEKRISAIKKTYNLPYKGMKITPEIREKLTKHRIAVLRPNEVDSPALAEVKLVAKEVERVGKSLEAQRATVQKYANDADTFVRGVEGMKQTLDEAVAAGKIDEEAATVLTGVIEKYGSNMQHLAMAFIDDAEFRGAFVPAKNLILVSSEKIKHEGIAAGLEELFHGMEKTLTPEMRVEIQQSYINDLNADIERMKATKETAKKLGFDNIAKEFDATLAWLHKALADSAEGKRATSMPPIRDFYKYSDTSEYWASKMMDYEWDRLQGLTDPMDNTILGKASKWYRDFSRAITDGYKDLMGDDEVRKIWKKLSKEELKPNGNPLHSTPWFDSVEDAEAWAKDFSLRPGDGWFNVEQRPLPEGVKLAMERTSPETLQRRSWADRNFGADQNNIGGLLSRIGKLRDQAIVKLLEEYDYAAKYEKDRYKHRTSYAGEQRGLAVEESGYAALKQYRLRDAVVSHALVNGMIMYDKVQGIVKNVAGKRGLKPILEEAYKGGVYYQLMSYLKASREAETMRTKGVPASMTDAEISAAKALGRETFEVNGQRKTVEEAAREVHEWMRGILQFGMDAGIINVESAKSWEEALYVPLLIHEAAFANHARDLAGPFNQRVNPVDPLSAFEIGGLDSIAHKNQVFTNPKRAVEHRTGLPEGMVHADLLEGMVRMSRHLVSMSLKNQAAARTLKVMSRTDAGPPAAVRLDGEPAVHSQNIFTVLENGKKVFYEMKDPELYRMMTHFGADRYQRLSQHPLIKALLVTPKRFFTNAITRAPEFLLKNPQRDFMSAWATGTAKNSLGVRDDFAALLRAGKGMANAYKSMGRTVWDFASGEVKEYARNPELLAMSAAGMSGAGYMGSEAVSVTDNFLKAIKRDSAPMRHLNPVRWWNWMEEVANVSELSARKYMYDNVIKAGGSEAEAVHASLDLINYSMKGSHPILGFLLDVVPFMKARLAGLNKLRMVTTEGDNFSLKNAVIQRSLMMATASTALYAMNQAFNSEDYNALTEQQKDSFWHAWVGDAHIRIPKPFEIGALAGTMPERLMSAMYGHGEDVGPAFYRALVDTFNLGIVPQALIPIQELRENREGYTGRPIVTPSQERLAPEAQYSQSTSESIKALADAMPDWMPDTFRSPAQVQHLVDGYFATIGEYAMFMSDTLLGAVSNAPAAPETEWYFTPGIRAVASNIEPRDKAVSTKYLSSFYDYSREANKVYNTIKAYRESGKYEKANILEEKFLRDFALYGEAQATQRYLAQLNQQSRQILEDPEMSAEEKTVRLHEIKRESNEITKRFHDRRKEMK